MSARPLVVTAGVVTAGVVAGCGSGPAKHTGADAAQGWQEIVPTLTEVETVSVFVAGDGSYHTYRIPAVLETRDGTLLAFAEGRVGAAADRRENDIVLRRSTDNGASWGPLQVVLEQGVHSLNDPTPLEVIQGPHAGRVYLLLRRVSCRQEVIGGSCEPIGDLPYAPLLTWSDDQGQTWSDPRDLTEVAHQASDAMGPGIGIQLIHPPYAGRLVFPMWGRDLNYALFSDDGGESWEAGEPAAVDAAGIPGNEAQIAELSDGRLWMNARHTSSEGELAVGLRKVATSADGGQSWSDFVDDPQLPDLQVMASPLTFSTERDDDRQRLLFSMPVDVFRSNGTVRLSYDDAGSWPVEKRIIEGYFQYNSLVRLDCHHVGSLYERGLVTEEILFARFSLDWLTDGQDTPSCEPG